MAPHEPSVDELLTFHYECLQGMYFSEYHAEESGAFLFSSSIKDPYYNFFSPSSAMADESVPPEILDEFVRRDRHPALYMTPLADGSGAALSAGEPWARDAWLVGAADQLADTGTDPEGLHLAVVGAETREEYVATFSTAYSGDDPDDPYGQLDPAYAECLDRSFDHEVEGYKKYYLLATIGDAAVGVAAMFTAGSLAGVYGVGTVPSHRRRGIGEAMMARLARIAVDDDATFVMLQTESGSAVQRWYQKLGYRDIFTADYIQVGAGGAGL